MSSRNSATNMHIPQTILPHRTNVQDVHAHQHAMMARRGGGGGGGGGGGCSVVQVLLFVALNAKRCKKWATSSSETIAVILPG